MNEISRRRLALACCAAIALVASACGDDSGSSSPKCGDQVCTELQKCIDDVCKDLCGTEVCAEDKVCDEATQTCIDKTVDPCSLCTETQKCVDKVCKDLCGTEVCAEDKICDEVTHTCIDKTVDPCKTVNCLANQTCMNARCYDDGCLITDENGNVSRRTGMFQGAMHRQPLQESRRAVRRWLAVHQGHLRRNGVSQPALQ